MKKILPFRLSQLLFAVDLDRVKEVGSGGKISLIPHASLPLVGLMQKMGEIFPVWSLSSFLKEKKKDIAEQTVFIKILVNGELIVIPVDEALSARSIDDKWESFSQFGIIFYRWQEKLQNHSLNVSVSL